MNSFIVLFACIAAVSANALIGGYGGYHGGITPLASKSLGAPVVATYAKISGYSHPASVSHGYGGYGYGGYGDGGYGHGAGLVGSYGGYGLGGGYGGIIGGLGGSYGGYGLRGGYGGYGNYGGYGGYGKGMDYGYDNGHY
ncbi:uncharacterized protein LOC141854260 [Brevipalpus obovatus]|uniref:uncharacterized protein LOC141854260 n=1 Tax=Brevipalpus obovatus TaxID=246614 RepID=UPI003D9EDC09